MGSQVLDVSARLSAAGQHQHGVDQHLATVVERQTLTGDRDPSRERIAEAQTVGKGAKGMEANVGDHLVATAFHPHADRAVSVHLASTLLTRVRTRRQRQNPLSGGHFRGWGASGYPVRLGAVEASRSRQSAYAGPRTVRGGHSILGLACLAGDRVPANALRLRPRWKAVPRRVAVTISGCPNGRASASPIPSQRSERRTRTRRTGGWPLDDAM